MLFRGHFFRDFKPYHVPAAEAGRAEQDDITEAEELKAATDAFEITIPLVLDIGRNGRIDDPGNRAKAERLIQALEAALI